MVVSQSQSTVAQVNLVLLSKILHVPPPCIMFLIEHVLLLVVLIE
jgi:hypothetical protein